MLSRAYSASRFISWGIDPIGAMLASFVAEIWGMRTMFAIGGIVSTGPLFLFLTLISPRILEGREKQN